MIKINVASEQKKLEIECRHRRENIEKSLRGSENINLKSLSDTIASLQERIGELEQQIKTLTLKSQND